MKRRFKFSAVTLSLILVFGLFTSCLSFIMKDYVQAFNDGGLESFADTLFPLTQDNVENFSPRDV